MVSAGFSSGEYGGKVRIVMASATCKADVVCQPA